MKPAKSLQFQVEKNKFINHAIEEIPEEQLTLATDEIKVKVDLFSFPSRHSSYAVPGAIIQYRELFTPVGKQIQGWGVIPMWGYADEVE